MTRIAHLLLPLLLLLATPLRADGADVIDARVLTGWRMADGTHMAAVEIRLDPGWKTYWRAPGDLGIPPQFDWRASRNLAGVEIAWPTPKPLPQGGAYAIGYSDRVVFPLKVLPSRSGRDITLDGRLDLGVCEDICIPVALRISAMLPANARTRDPVIAAALADQPYSATEAGVRGVRCTIARDGDALSLTAEIDMPSAGARELVVVETDNPKIWIAPAKTRRDDGRIVAQTRLVHVEGRAFAVNRSALRLTVLGKRHAVDIQGCPAG